MRDLSDSHKYFERLKFAIISLFLIISFAFQSFSINHAENLNSNADTTALTTTTSAASTNSSPINLVDYYASPIKEIVKKGYLLVGFTNIEYKPFYYQLNGEWKGLDIDLAKDIASQLGVELRIDRSFQSYEEIYEALLQKKVDMVVAKFSRNLPRAMGVLFSKPYFSSDITIMVNRKMAHELKIEDYPVNYLKNNNATIAVRAQTSYVSFASMNFPKCTIKQNTTIEQMVEDVKNGTCLCAIYDEVEMAKVVKQDTSVSLYNICYNLNDTTDDLCIAFPNDSYALKQWIDIYLEKLPREINLNTLITDYPDVFEVIKNS